MMRDVKSPVKQTLSDAEVLDFLIRHSFSNKYALAAWSLPDKEHLQVIISRNPTHLNRETAIEDLKPGFVLAPFNRNNHTLFLEADYTFCLHDGKLMPPSTEAEAKSHDWLHDNKSALPFRETPFTDFLPQKIVPAYGTESYTDLVEEGLRAIESGIFEKVVPSRSRMVALPGGFNLVTSFLKLWKAYPDAFVSLTSSPESGTWIGASPEELVRVIDRTIFKTVALAGTQPYHEGQNLRHVSWTQKEIEEQALVERYIISCFKKIRLREYDEHGPKTVVAGNVMHLKTDFTVNLKETNFPQLGSVMLQLLHPTSAVCGMPLEPSLAFLEKYEGYNREYYSGYLGPVNMENEINLFVNLRCMQLVKGHALLYAGAGVTVDSIAVKEWEETEMKMNTLLSVIQ